jgi:VCBS repeat-containing protein
MLPTMSFSLAGGPGVRVAVQQTADGKLQVTASLNPSVLVGDLRGLFFHIGDESLLGGLSVTGGTTPIGTVRQGANAVSNLGGGVHMLGAAPAFDMGIVFGTASAAGADDIRSVTFTLEHAITALTLDLFSSAQFGAVIGSVGTSGGSRLGTVRATGTAPLVESDNVPPEAGNDSANAAEDGNTPLSALLDNDSDANSDSLTITAVTQPAKGSVSLLGGQVMFSAGNAFNGLGAGDSEDVTFTYTVSDGEGGTDTATVTVTVIGANDGPDAVDDAFTARSNQLIGSDAPGLLVNDTDADGDTLQVIGFDYAGPGTLSVSSDGHFSYTPAAGFVGTDSFTYTVSDGVQQDTATVAIHVVNSAPTASDDAQTVAEDGSLNGSVTGLIDDVDGDGVTFALVGGGLAGLTFNADGSYSYAPPADFNGTVSFQFKANDGTADSNTGTVEIQVTAVNDAPTAIALSNASVPENSPNGALVGLLSASDIDSAAVTFSVVGSPVAFAIVGNELRVNGALDFETQAAYSVTIRANDGAGGTHDETFTIAVTDVNETPDNTAPTVEDANLTIDEDAALNGNLNDLATDSENDPLTFALVSTMPDGLTFNPDGSYTYDAPDDFNGQISFGFVASDGQATSNQGTVTITVNAVNDAPTAPTGVTRTVDEDTSILISTADLIAGATDADGDAIVVSGVTSNAFITGTLEAGGIHVVGTPDTNGVHTITYQLSDGHGGLVDGVITLDITPVNDRPVVTPTTFQGTEDVPFVIAIADLLAQVASDVDVGDTVSFLNVTGDFGGAVTVADGNLTFTPPPNRDSAGSFFLSVTDGQSNAGGTITINLAPVNDAPAAGDDLVARDGNPQVISFATLFANDVDVDTPAASRTIGAITNESGVTVAVNNIARTVTVTYDPTHVGAYGFDYTVSDGAGGFDTASVTLNLAPVATDDTTTIGENTGWSVYHFLNVIGNDVDSDGDLLTVASVQTLGGAPIVAERWDSNADGRFDSLRLYVDDPSNNTNGTFHVEYTVSDQRGGTDTAVVTITVTPEDDAPLIRPDLQSSEIVSTSQFTPIDISFSALLANDEHPDGTDFTITSVQTFVRGSAALVDTDGDLVNDSVRFTPDANTPLFEDFSNSWLAYFYYTVTETNGDGDTASTWAYVRVFDVNEGPTAADDTVTRTGTNAQVIGYDALFGNDVDWDSPRTGWTISAIANQTGVTAVTDNTARTVTVTFETGFTGTYAFDYTLDDGEGGTSSASVTLNTAPAAADDETTIAENTAWSLYHDVDVIGNDGDADGDKLTVIAVTALGDAPVAGFGYDSDGDGHNESVRFYIDDPLNDTHGTFQAQYTVSDGRGGTDTAVLTITVTPENDAPRGVVENPGVLTTQEDTAIVIPVAALLANGDYDPDGEAFWIASVTEWGSYGGDAVLDDNGTADRSDDAVVFTPDADIHGSAYFYYVLEDASGAQDLNTYAYVTVTPVNDPVTANDDVIARLFPEAGTQTISRAQMVGNDLDVDNDAAITAVVAGTNVSSIVLNADQSVTVTYTAGAATFTYTLSDGTFSDTALVSLNSGPKQTGTPGVLNLTEDTQSYFTDDQLIALAGVTDPNGDNLFISGYGTNPDLSVSDGWWWSYEANWLTPVENFDGPTTFVFTISDGNAATDLTVRLDVIVEPVDDPAVAVDDANPAWVTNEETAIVIRIADLLANDFDVEGNAFSATSFYTYGWASGPGTVVDNGDGTVTYTPGADVAEGYNPWYGGNSWSGHDGPGFFYQVTGGDTAFVRITVNNANDPVTAQDDYVARLPGAPETQDVAYVQMADNDGNPDPKGVLTIVSVQNAVNGTAVLNDNGTPDDPTDDFVTFTHTGGDASFQYTVEDERGTTSTATVYFNGAPLAEPDAITVSEAEATYAPDGSRRDIPIDRLELVGNDTDPEGQTLYLASPIPTLPEMRWDTSVIESVSYSHYGVTVRLLDPDWSGETWFEYRAHDFGTPDAFSEPVRVTLTVEDGNDAPFSAWDYWLYNGAQYNDTNPATNDMVGYEDSFLDIPVSRLLGGQFIGGVYQFGADFDEEGDPLSIDPASLSSPHGTVQLVEVGGEQFVRFTPRGELNGELYFDYAATDGTTTAPQGHAYVYILPVNDAPAVSDGEIPVPVGQTEFFINVAQLLTFVSDEDHGDAQLTFLGAHATSGGSVTVETGGIRFFGDASGDPLQFEFRYEDPLGATDSGVITLVPTVPPPVVLYFQGYDYGTGSSQLWHYVPAESPFVGIALPEIDGSPYYYPYEITPFRDGVAFITSDGLHSFSEVGGLNTLVSGAYIEEFVVVGENIYAIDYSSFHAFGQGTAQGTVAEGGYGFSELTQGHGSLYFVGYDDAEGWQQVFRYDPATQLIEQLTSESGGAASNIRDLAVTSDAVFFAADTYDPATEDYDSGVLFRLDLNDGTLSSVSWTGMAEDPSVYGLTAIGEQVYFIGRNDSGASQLWRADDSGSGVSVFDNSYGQDGSFGHLDDAASMSLIAFQDGVLANFYDRAGDGNYYLFFGDQGGFSAVDDFNYAPSEVEVLDGEAFYIAYEGSNVDGQEVFVFDGTTVQRLTTHEADYYMTELEVISRDRLFVTSSGSGFEGSYGNVVYEYSPAQYGDASTHRLDRDARTIAYRNLTAADGGLYFELELNGSTSVQFASYSIGYVTPVSGFNLSSNGDKGFFGDMPLAAFDVGQGTELSFFDMTDAMDFVDIAPGQDPDAPANAASSGPFGFVQLEQLGDSSVADIYAVAGTPALGPDTARLFRISFDVDTGTYSFDQVSGLSAVGSPAAPGTPREFILAPIALGDAVLANKCVADAANGVHTHELWVVRGLTAALVDDSTGQVTRTEAARTGDFIFFEDEVTGGFGAELKILDLMDGTTTLVDINLGADGSAPRELVAAGGGVYMRAVTDGAGLADDTELVRVETDGSFTVIDLRDDAESTPGALPRQITAVDADTVIVFGDTDAGPTLWSVTGTGVDFSIGLWESGVARVPFLEGGTEIYGTGLFFFAETWTGQGTQLFRYDIATQGIEQITSGTAPLRDASGYSMEVADDVLWFVFDEGYGDGLELHSYDETYGWWGAMSDLDQGSAGYDAWNLAAVAQQDVLVV